MQVSLPISVHDIQWFTEKLQNLVGKVATQTSKQKRCGLRKTHSFYMSSIFLFVANISLFFLLRDMSPCFSQTF